MGEFIAELFIESIFGKIIRRIFCLIKLIGFFALKLITFSSLSITDIKVKYKDSSKPYFLGFGITISLIYLIATILN